MYYSWVELVEINRCVGRRCAGGFRPSACTAGQKFQKKSIFLKRDGEFGRRHVLGTISMCLGHMQSFCAIRRAKLKLSPATCVHQTLDCGITARRLRRGSRRGRRIGVGSLRAESLLLAREDAGEELPVDGCVRG